MGDNILEKVMESLVFSEEPEKDIILNKLVGNCPMCSAVYRGNGELKKHLEGFHHIPSSMLFYMCKCDIRYVEQKQLTRHLKSCKTTLLLLCINKQIHSDLIIIML